MYRIRLAWLTQGLPTSTLYKKIILRFTTIGCLCQQERMFWGNLEEKTEVIRAIYLNTLSMQKIILTIDFLKIRLFSYRASIL